MKRSFSVFIILCSIVIVTGSRHSSSPTDRMNSQVTNLLARNYPQDTVSKTVYTCPMHPEVVSDKADKCSKCGMNLVVKENLEEVFTCPMHPEVKSGKAGKCPKCGMNFVRKEESKKEKK